MPQNPCVCGRPWFAHAANWATSAATLTPSSSAMNTAATESPFPHRPPPASPRKGRIPTPDLPPPVGTLLSVMSNQPRHGEHPPIALGLARPVDSGSVNDGRMASAARAKVDKQLRQTGGLNTRTSNSRSISQNAIASSSRLPSSSSPVDVPAPSTSKSKSKQCPPGIKRLALVVLPLVISKSCP